MVIPPGSKIYEFTSAVITPGQIQLHWRVTSQFAGFDNEFAYPIGGSSGGEAQPGTYIYPITFFIYRNNILIASSEFLSNYSVSDNSFYFNDTTIVAGANYEYKLSIYPYATYSTLTANDKLFLGRPEYQDTYRPYGSNIISGPYAPAPIYKFNNIINDNGRVTLSWGAISPIDESTTTFSLYRDGVVVARGNIASGIFTDIGNGNLSFTEYNLINNNQYQYKLYAYDTSSIQNESNLQGIVIGLPQFKLNIDNEIMLLDGVSINNGQLYCRGKVDLTYNSDKNLQNINIGLNIPNSFTIDSLYISNNEHFDTSQTLLLTGNIANSAQSNYTNLSSDDNNCRVIELNPDYIVDNQTLASIVLSSTLQLPTVFNPQKTFLIKNWPLSGSGGEKRVYVRAIVGGLSTTYVSENIGWQETKTPKPNNPIANSKLINNNTYFRNKSRWLFSASGEQQTTNSLLNKTGVGRYIGTLVDTQSNIIYSSINGASQLRTFGESIAPVNIIPKNKLFNADLSSAIPQNNLSSNIIDGNFICGTNYTIPQATSLSIGTVTGFSFLKYDFKNRIKFTTNNTSNLLNPVLDSLDLTQSNWKKTSIVLTPGQSIRVTAYGQLIKPSGTYIFPEGEYNPNTLDVTQQIYNADNIINIVSGTEPSTAWAGEVDANNVGGIQSKTVPPYCILIKARPDVLVYDSTYSSEIKQQPNYFINGKFVSGDGIFKTNRLVEITYEDLTKHNPSMFNGTARVWIIFNDKPSGYSNNSGNFNLTLQIKDTPSQRGFISGANISGLVGDGDNLLTIALSSFNQSFINGDSKNIEIRAEIDISGNGKNRVRIIWDNSDIDFISYEFKPPSNMQEILQYGFNFDLLLSSNSDNSIATEAFISYSETSPSYHNSQPINNKVVISVGKCVFPNFSTNQTTFDLCNYASAFISSGTAQVSINEIYALGGDVWIDADLGSCSTTDNLNIFYPTLSLGDNKLFSKQISDSPVLYTNNSNSYDYNTSNKVDLYRNNSNTSADVLECDFVDTTLSTNFSIDFSYSNFTSNDSLLYIVFSEKNNFLYFPDGSYVNKPLFSRVNILDNFQNVPMYSNTGSIIFDKLNNVIKVAYRNESGYLEVRNLCVMNSISGNYRFNITSNLHKNSSRITQIDMRLIDDSGNLISSANVDINIPSINSSFENLGYYIGFGIAYLDGVNSVTTLKATVNKFTVTALPNQISPNDDLMPYERIFIKSNDSYLTSKKLLGRNMLSGQTDLGNYLYDSGSQRKSFIQLISINDFNSSILKQKSDYSYYADNKKSNIKLLELKIKQTSKSNSIKIRFYTGYSNGQLLTPISSWINPTFIRTSGQINLVQFIISDIIEVTPYSNIYIVVDVPSETELLSVFNEVDKYSTDLSFFNENLDINTSDNSYNPIDNVTTNDNEEINYHYITSDMYTGTYIKGLWYKLFSDYYINKNNSNDHIQQFSVRAESHAGIESYNSNFSKHAITDTIPPTSKIYYNSTYPTVSLTKKPKINLVSNPQSIITNISVESVDGNDAPFLFRVLEENSIGGTSSNGWQKWADYSDLLDQYKINYNVYSQQFPVYFTMNGGVNFSGDINSDLTPYFKGHEVGTRKIWCQIMDYAGNIAETFPLTILSKGKFIVDTTEPSGSVSAINKETLLDLKYSNNPNQLIKSEQDIYDLSGVKDFRYRINGASSWSSWLPNSEYINAFMSDFGQGLNKLEFQFRDFGGNALQEQQIWSSILNFKSKNILFVSGKVWKSDFDSIESVYLSGIETNSWENLSAQDSGNGNYISGFSFSPYVGEINSYQTIIYPRLFDKIIVTVNGISYTRLFPKDLINPWTLVSNYQYYIDNNNGVIVFKNQIITSDIVKVSIKREASILYKWDGYNLSKIYDFGQINENIILSICPIITSDSNMLLLGGGTGGLHSYDGKNIKSFIYQASENNISLPITNIFKYKFDGELDNYVYLTTGILPRLLRNTLLGSISGYNWVDLNISGLFDANYNSDITCFTTYSNSLVMGTSKGNIIHLTLEYNPEGTDFTEKTELYTINQNSLEGSQIYDKTSYISDLCASAGQVFASILNRPEIWSFSTKQLYSIENQQNWSTQLFNQNFTTNTKFWQYYSSDFNGNDSTTGITDFVGNTIPTSYNSLSPVKGEYTKTSIVDSSKKEFIYIKSLENKISMFSCEADSDWNAIISNNNIKSSYSNQIINYMIESNVQSVYGSGRQGLDVSDGRYNYQVYFYSNGIKISSGSNSKFVYFNNATINTQSLIDNLPTTNQQIIWNFSSNKSENSGLYFNGNTTNTLNIQGWLPFEKTINTTNTLGSIGVALSQVDYNSSENKNSDFVRIIPSMTKNPTIYNKTSSSGSMLPFVADAHSKIYITTRIGFINTSLPTTLDYFNNAKIKITWSTIENPDLKHYHWEELDLADTLQNVNISDAMVNVPFKTYEFNPAWSGTVNYIAVQIIGLPKDDIYSNLAYRNNIAWDIDSIIITNENIPTDISKGFVNIRVGIYNKNITIWADNKKVIDENDFLNLPTSKINLKFGKFDIDNIDSSSTWAWSSIKYTIGQPVPIFTKLIKQWNMTAQLPSTSGINKLIHHFGTVKAIAKGVIWNRTFDNSIDHGMKIFTYNSENQSWGIDDSQSQNIINPIFAITYKDNLIISGEKSQ